MATNPLQPLFEVVISALAELASFPFFSFLWSWLKRIIPLFAVFLLVISIGLSAYTFFRQQRDRQLKFFVSSGNGGGAEQVDLIQKKIRDGWSFWGPNYFVTEFQTGGSLDNLRNVKRDQEGNAVGVAIEGLTIDKNDVGDLNTLVPLQWCYLHFICRTEILRALELKHLKDDGGSGLTPVSLIDWAKAYHSKVTEFQNKPAAEIPDGWPIRIYLGQPNSGTRTIAEMVLDNVGIRPELLEPTTYISNLEELPERLLRGKIDGAFILEPRDSSVVSRLADDKDLHCTQISIDGVEDLLGNNPFLVKCAIPPYTYGWSFWQSGNDDKKNKVVRDWHLGEVQTIAARRILATSAKMSDSDAYHLANLVRGALPASNFARHTDTGSWPAPNDKINDRQLNYDLHPGVVWNSQAGPGISWLGRNAAWAGPLLLAIAISFVTEVKSRIPKWLANESSTKDPPPGPPVIINVPQLPAPSGSTARSEIEARIEATLKEVHDAREKEIDTGRPTLSATIDGWHQAIGGYYRQVHAVHQAGQLTGEAKIALNGRLLQLRSELDLLSSPPWGPPQARARRGTTKRRATQAPDAPAE